LGVEDLQQQDPEDRRNEVPGVVLRLLVHGVPPLGRPPARAALFVNTAKSRRLRAMNALIDIKLRLAPLKASDAAAVSPD
jgi:hypothetical protein